MTDWPSLQGVIGANVKRLRTQHGVTQSALARCARAYGLKWQDTRVSELERGSLTLSAETVLALVFALTLATREETTLGDLVQGEGRVELNPDLSAPLALVQRLYSGQGHLPRVEQGLEHSHSVLAEFAKGDDDLVTRILGSRDPRAFYEFDRHGWDAARAETKVLRSMGVSPRVLSALSYVAWGRTLADERDSRSSPGDSAQKRGRITRDLLDELRQILKASDG